MAGITVLIMKGGHDEGVERGGRGGSEAVRYSTLPVVVQIVSCIRCGAEGVWWAAWARGAAKPCARYI